jgi:hypothetical protein
VHRAFLLIATILLVAPILAASSPSQTCVQQCDDDGPDGDCPPDCPECVCCPHLTPAVPMFSMVPVSLPAPTCRRVETTQLPPLSADPREITHVPKLVAA